MSISKFLVVIFCVMFFVGCPSFKTTNTNYNKIQKDMTQQQVRSILGNPISISVPEGSSGKIENWHYRTVSKKFLITFTDGKVSARSAMD